MGICGLGVEGVWLYGGGVIWGWGCCWCEWDDFGEQGDVVVVVVYGVSGWGGFRWLCGVRGDSCVFCRNGSGCGWWFCWYCWWK